MYKALFLDFYGTLVHEDDEYIEEICANILKSSSTQATTREIGAYWWKAFSTRFVSSYGDHFMSQRDIEIHALEDTIDFYKSSLNPKELSQILFDHWQSPQLFQDTKVLLGSIKTPTIILSNIDRNDIEAAVRYNGLGFDNIITSEDVRAYKPRSEMFQEALRVSNFKPSEVLHVGDSLTSDVVGAQEVGIKVAWINRKYKECPHTYSPDYIIHSLDELIPLLS